jgi:5-methylcytosine-specific restriction protein A
MSGFPLKVRAAIIERAKGCCEVCGEARPGMQAHHRRVKGMGGSRRDDTHLPSNAFWLCAVCHHIVHANPEESYRNGWLVRQGETPSEVPVWRHGRVVLLTDTGDVQEVQP